MSPANASASPPTRQGLSRLAPRPADRGSPFSVITPRRYRLVDLQGMPHPVLDDLYDSLEAAWSEALNCGRSGVDPQPVRWESEWK